MNILRGMAAVVRLKWWTFVLWCAPDGWEGRPDALWFQYRAREDFERYLEGK